MEISQFCFDTGLKPTGNTVGVWQLLTFSRSIHSVCSYISMMNWDRVTALLAISLAPRICVQSEINSVFVLFSFFSGIVIMTFKIAICFLNQRCPFRSQNLISVHSLLRKFQQAYCSFLFEVHSCFMAGHHHHGLAPLNSSCSSAHSRNLGFMRYIHHPQYWGKTRKH